MCKNQKDNLIEEKKRLEEMNVVLRRYKSKDEQNFNTQHQLLLQKLELIVTNITEVENLIAQAEGSIAESKENNVEELDKKINEEKEKIMGHIDKLTSENLMSKATPFNTAIEELNKIKKKFDDSGKRLNTYKSY